jgi:GSH-dependent disulfide-bond oxidoreductase
MIELFSGKTPNGHKIPIMLEECGLAYHVHVFDYSKREYQQYFQKISPNNKIPAIIDRDAEGGPLSIFGAGAILIYLADKVGKFLPRVPGKRARVIEWLMFETGEINPVFSQSYHFVRVAPERIPYAIAHFINESIRLLQILELQFRQHTWVAGDYSIADMALYPWVDAIMPLLANNKREEELNALVHTHRWMVELGNREAVRRGMQIPAETVAVDSINGESS